LDASYQAPTHFECILHPIIQLGPLQTLVFRNWASFGVCRLAHFLMKRSPSIRTLIFENYSFLVPAQLRLEKIKGLLPLSITFNNCKFSEPLLMNLIDQLGLFKGQFRQLTINTVQFTMPLLKHFFKSLRLRCWRKLAILELNNVDGKSMPSDRVIHRVEQVLERCRFLQCLSLSSWTSGIRVPLSLFSRSCFLGEIHLCDLDMAQPFMPFALPHGVHLLDVSRSHFTTASLQSFFTILSNAKAPLSLVLQDLVLPEAHWRTFFDALPRLNRMPCVFELDWSGNQLGPAGAFVSYFFDPSTNVRFFGFGRIFTPATIADFTEFVNALPRDRLVGLAVTGSAERNFAGQARAFIGALEGAPTIKVLDISGHKFTDADLLVFPEFFAAHGHITELTCDGTAATTESALIAFYQKVKLEYYAAPAADLERVGDTQFPKALYPASTPRTRAYYFSSLSYSGTFSHRDLAQYSVVSTANLATLQCCSNSDEALLAEPAQTPHYCPASIDIPPGFTDATRREAYSYKIVVDTINRSLIGPYVAQVVPTDHGVTLLRLELRLLGDAVNVWVWETPDPEHPAYYSNAAGVFCLFSEEAEWQDRLEQLQAEILPPHSRIHLLALPTTVNTARTFWVPNRIELAEVETLTWPALQRELFSFIARIHERAKKDERLRYRAEDEFKGAPDTRRDMVVLLCAGYNCPVEKRFVAHLKLFREQPAILARGEYLVESPISVFAMRAFLGNLLGETINFDQYREQLLQLAREFGDEDLEQSCNKKQPME
jgi:hypothetical protein